LTGRFDFLARGGAQHPDRGRRPARSAAGPARGAARRCDPVAL